MTNIIRKKIKVSQLKIGDTVEVNNQLITVSKNYIKYCSFMGLTFQGDRFINGIR